MLPITGMNCKLHNQNGSEHWSIERLFLLVHVHVISETFAASVINFQRQHYWKQIANHMWKLSIACAVCILINLERATHEMSYLHT